jgi:hypothetical protein
MKKFECKECYIAPCILDVGEETNRLPKMCPYGVNGAIWHEAKAETTTKSSQLPDWCRVGEWVYYPEDMGHSVYLKISEIKGGFVHAKEKDDYDPWQISYNAICEYAKPARKRPFNAEEMRGLVGKVIEDGDNALFVSVYYGKEKCISAGCVADFDGDDLMRCSCDGKPCYKLEHLENGGWVE